MATSKSKKKATSKKKSTSRKSTAKKATQVRNTPAKSVSPDTPRYCLEIVDGKYCNGEVVKSGIVHNKNSECYCTKCGRYYLKYTGRPTEPKTDEPTDRQVKAAEKRDAELQDEINRLKADGMTDATLLRLQAHKNLAYSGRKETPTPVVLDDKDAQVLSAVVDPASIEITDDDFEGMFDDLDFGTLDDLDTPDAQTADDVFMEDALDALDNFDASIADDEKEVEPIADDLGSFEDEINQALAELDDDFEDIEWDSLDDPDSGMQASLVDDEELDTLFFPLEKPEESDTQALTQEEEPKAKRGGGMSFFSKRNLLDEEFPDIIEEVEFETVVLKEPEPFKQGVTDDEVDAMWKDAMVEKHKLTADQVKNLLSEESARLKVENYKLDGIDFNPKNLPDEVILAEIRDKSLTSLMLSGKTSTQDEVDRARAIRAKREAEAQQAREEYIAKSSRAEQRLPFNFLSGEMTPEQSAEFLKYGLISKRNLKKRPPSPERLHSIVNRKRILDSMGTPSKVEIPMEVVEEYVQVWESISAAICNKEYGEHSYWIAAGTSWAVPEFVDDVIKTAFATGLSVTPMITLGELKILFERAHGYLNSLEFLAHSPKAMRDSIERFTLFNEAYKAIYEGTTPMFKPKDAEAPKFTWESYAQSDIVIIQLPETGLVTGGLAMLSELLRTRAMTRKATIIITTTSMKRLMELNAGLVPALFGLNGIAVVAAKDVNPTTHLDTSTYVYHTVHEDGAKSGSPVQNRKRNVESKNKK